MQLTGPILQVIVARNWANSETGGFDLGQVSKKLEKDGFSMALSDGNNKGDENDLQQTETCEEMAARLYADLDQEGAGSG